MHVGVDEAGKGPVLGSMFVAAVRATPESLPADVADSKDLTPGKRNSLAETIRTDAAATHVVDVPVERIDDPATDMNELTVAAHAEAMTAVAREGVTAYADACDTSVARYERRLRQGVDVALDLQAEHGADEIRPIVSAASILAKVARDTHISTLSTQYGDIGSGYPGDETTRDFLRGYVQDHGELPPCARASWQTSRDVLAAVDQSSLSEF